MYYGEDIQPNRREFIPKAMRAMRKHVSHTHHDVPLLKPNGVLRVNLPKLSYDDVIVPGSYFISFALNVSSEKDKARSVVPNVGRKIVKSLRISFENEDVVFIDDYCEFMNYRDLWLSGEEKSRRIPQGIQTKNGLGLRVNASGAKGDAEEDAIAKTRKNRFRIPIDFEVLDHVGSYHPHSMKDQLKLALVFNDPEAIILGSTATLAAAADRDYSYTVTDIRQEWDQITNVGLAREMEMIQNNLEVPYKKVIRYDYQDIEKSKTSVNLPLNITPESLSQIIILAIDPDDRKAFAHTNIYKNLDVTNVKIKIGGNANQLYDGGMLTEHTYDAVKKLFKENGVSEGEFLTQKFALCFDFRPSTDNKLHGNGPCLVDSKENAVTLEISRVKGGSGKLTLYIFIIEDGTISLRNGRYIPTK